MERIVAILIEGDNENSLGGACARDIWNISKKLVNETTINPHDIFTFFHELDTNKFVDKYTEKITQLRVPNISSNTIENIKHIFDDVVKLSHQQNITIFFHYSGHGFQVADPEGDELDGLDEAFLSSTMKDDFIFNHLVSKLSQPTKLFALIDACHSGSGIDLPYVYRNQSWLIAKHGDLNVNCSAYSLSACNDRQCATQDVGITTGFAGSLTAGFCDCCNFNSLFSNPIQCYVTLSKRLSLLGQTVELFCSRKLNTT